MVVWAKASLWFIRKRHMLSTVSSTMCFSVKSTFLLMSPLNKLSCSGAGHLPNFLI